MANNASQRHSTLTSMLAPPDPAASEATLSAPVAAAERRQWLQRMVADVQWQCSERVRQCVAALLGDGRREIQPEALLVVAHELACYQDFRRLRALEAQLRRCEERELPFSRQHWQRARQAEQALREYRRHIREQSFVLAPPDQFRIH